MAARLHSKLAYTIQPHLMSQSTKHSIDNPSLIAKRHGHTTQNRSHSTQNRNQMVKDTIQAIPLKYKFKRFAVTFVKAQPCTENDGTTQPITGLQVCTTATTKKLPSRFVSTRRPCMLNQTNQANPHTRISLMRTHIWIVPTTTHMTQVITSIIFDPLRSCIVYHKTISFLYVFLQKYFPSH